jgi:5'-AMP-activated protein kinase catalytic alpha subunit
VKRKRLEETEAIFFMQQIIAGVEYIHKNGIVHRDLKPENLLLDHNKNVKIVDFGLSNQYKNGEKLKTACGSPCYAAPEMIAGKKYECIKVDIWSCGIILYAMLCGYLPFEDPNTSKLYKKIMAGDYEVPRLLTHDSKDILKCILNVSPESRYTIEQIRSSKWYNLTNRTYVGAGILVGKDQIDVNERLVQRMAKDGLDPHQIKSYVASNRHNYITAYYYLLKKKAEIDPSVLNYEPSPTKSHSRGESPLIYRPDHKRDGFIPQKKVDGKEKANISRTNDSFDIASSLAEAHKNKFLASTNLSHKHAKQDSLDKF